MPLLRHSYVYEYEGLEGIGAAIQMTPKQGRSLKRDPVSGWHSTSRSESGLEPDPTLDSESSSVLVGFPRLRRSTVAGRASNSLSRRWLVAPDTFDFTGFTEGFRMPLFALFACHKENDKANSCKSNTFPSALPTHTPLLLYS